MAERQIEKMPPRSKRYVAVMVEAARRAHSRAVAAKANPLVTIADVFEAVCVVHPEAFEQLLGGGVPVPDVKPTDCGEPPKRILQSSEVDRYLSPYGGARDGVRYCLSSGKCSLSRVPELMFSERI